MVHTKDGEDTQEGGDSAIGGKPIENGESDTVAKVEDVSLDESSPKENGETTASRDGQEIVLIQDTSFTVNIHVPGLEPFTLAVSSMELVQEIQHILYDKEETCHRTCFTLQLDNQVLDNFAELKTIEGLAEGSIIKVVEEPYTVREARLHVRHVRDLLKSIDNSDAYTGSNGMSLSFLNTITEGDIMDTKRTKPDPADCLPPDNVLPSTKDRPLVQLHPMNKDTKASQCLKVITYSGWNPPPGTRRLHGDLIYIMIVTGEDKKFHITGSTRGFFVNQSTDDVFNPKPASSKFLNHALVDLMNQISPMFKKNFTILLKKRSQKHPFERVPTPYQVHSWLAPHPDHPVDSIRAEDGFSAKVGYEEHIPGQTRDWNEELQTTRELPRKTLPERLIRERAIFKIHSDFVAAASRAAVAVIDGNIMAINPGETSKMQMFIWNNIFFSLGFDVKDHYKDFGGDAAAYAAPCNDLQGIKAYTGVDVEGVYVLGTVVVDYRGYRVTAQSIIPGILEREQEQSVVYGSTDFGTTVVSSEKYRDLLEKTSTALRIRPHKVVNSEGEEVMLLSSVECKGIVGNDGRHYILDLLRTFPPDLNFLPVNDEEPCKEIRDLGFPVEHRHKLVCLRQELVEAFIETRYINFVRTAADQFNALKKNAEMKAGSESQNGGVKGEEIAQPENANKESTSEDKGEVLPDINKSSENADKIDDMLGAEKNVENAKKIVEGILSPDHKDISSEIMQKVVQDLCNRSDTTFDLAFNPDVYQPRVKHADPDGAEIKKDKQLVRDAADFLLLQQLPQVVRECREHQISPMDGDTLSEALHQRGINIRYLGKFTEMVAKHPNLQFLQGIATFELINRAAKHLFQVFMHGVESSNLAVAISHFLNSFLSSFPNPFVHLQSDDLSKNAKKKNKKRARALPAQEPIEWALETPHSLWEKIVQEVSSYYHYRIEHDSLDSLVDEFEANKIIILRAFCSRCGIQLLLKDYNLYSRTKPAFTEDDIIDVFPIVKHIHPKASDAYNFFTSGQSKIQQGYLRDGHELISEALNLLNNVYGPIHPDIAACNKLLARLNYIMGDHAEALSFQQRALLISERVLGVDHPSTITEYAHLALYCFANGMVVNALRLLYRARYLSLMCSGENHPEVALIDSNIGLMLHAMDEFDISLRFLDKALQLNIKFFGQTNLKVAMSYHLVARAHSCRGDFRTALLNEKQAFSIYQESLGPDHERTKESADCLNHLTKQAVQLQKKMNDMAKGDAKTVNFPPIQIQPPTLNSVLETLNIINGIFFVHLSPSDIEKLKAQILGGKEASNESIKELDDTPAVAGTTENTFEDVEDLE